MHRPIHQLAVDAGVDNLLTGIVDDGIVVEAMGTQPDTRAVTEIDTKGWRTQHPEEAPRETAGALQPPRSPRGDVAEAAVVDSQDASGIANDALVADKRTRRHLLRVDFAERHAALPDLARASGDFDVRFEQLDVGDYLVDGGVLVERKTYADFATSLVDGRLFTQAAALARSPNRPVLLLEGPKPPRMPDVHSRALKGAIVSLAVMWRLPVVCARNPEDSLQILRCLAHQLGRTQPGVLQRYDRKPKRLTSRKIYILQGLPGVGPALANRRLLQFGTVERVMTADESMLVQVRGVGAKKAQRIRGLVS